MTFTKHGIVTSDPLIGVMFLGKCVDADCGGPIFVGPLEGVSSDKQERFCVDTDVVKEITIPYPLIADAIKPVEGEPCFRLRDGEWNSYSPDYYAKTPAAGTTDVLYVRANPITTGKTVGELRELIAKIAGESQEG